ncbi:MAG: RnfABCDGE type electron transport complex subunit D [Candidatus Omnitrophota bacterium]
MNKLILNISPHIFSPVDTRKMMKGVIKALIPVICASLYFFRVQAFILISVTVFSCVLTEYLLQKLRGKEIKIRDFSAVVTGLLLALVLPPAIPLWMAVVGGIFAIALGKEIFGGLGLNIFNPALLARAFLMAAFPVALTTWTNPVGVDAVTRATPLALAKFDNIITPHAVLFWGKISGSLGETSAAALLLGLGYLLFRKIIDYRIPAAYITTVVVVSFISGLFVSANSLSPLFHILSGGLLLGAVFMATDPATSPITSKGRWIFGVGCGLVTMTIRLKGALPEGVMFSILFMNAVTPLINRFSRPRRFGGKNG